MAWEEAEHRGRGRPGVCRLRARGRRHCPRGVPAAGHSRLAPAASWKGGPAASSPHTLAGSCSNHGVEGEAAEAQRGTDNSPEVTHECQPGPSSCRAGSAPLC